MGGKRGNENAQMRREDYEAQLARDEADEPEVTFGIPRASEDQLKTRRIVRARRPAQRPQEEQTAGAASVNPFAKLTAAVPTATSTNPFASLGTRFGTTTEQPSFSFGTKTSQLTNQPAVAAPAAQSPSDNKTSSSIFDLEKAIKDSLKELNPEMKSTTTRLDAIIKSAANQIHEWVLKNPESTTEEPNKPTADSTKDESTARATASAVATKTTATEDSKPEDTNENP
eukprot:scaffold6898_cov149-Amphora_coffeaeformis.AAC.1